MAEAKTVLTPYDVAEHLRTPEEMAAYLEASIEEANGDTAFIAKALYDIARAKGLAQVTQELGLSCASLWRSAFGTSSYIRYGLKGYHCAWLKAKH